MNFVLIYDESFVLHIACKVLKKQSRSRKSTFFRQTFIISPTLWIDTVLKLTEFTFTYKLQYPIMGMLSLAQCGNFWNFLPLRFYVKSILKILGVWKLPFSLFQRLWILLLAKFSPQKLQKYYQNLKFELTKSVLIMRTSKCPYNEDSQVSLL